ncbi:CheY chemotaxis protein or a CheY-like REC (receiver) domain [Enhydrobacter aerosaccus]|uniref:CheY chemotaxis protein or a CheY-like REC (Receiver) domain n=1 Tax=Enhydrobacter aerosaccus TaxID=225324 RepID=A0A1T4SZ55_9HYPH|nr:response regulator [Enhydrobacter aerosaccus]SKA33524.1 CheY chemotaxis protein or a CheY-like REC (receiver) domain [Enhydrobacter aerosaccus]
MYAARSFPPLPAEQPEPLRRVVLVVEDDILVRAVAADNLRDCGLDVVEAGSADEAIRLLKAGVRVDLVFSDVNMPGSMDGFGLSAWLRDHRPEAKILLTSGYLRTSQQLDAVPAHGGMLVKPYRQEELARRISEMLDR